MTIDPTEKHGTLPALRIDNLEGDDTKVEQTVTAKPNTRYRFSGYIKTKGVLPIKRNGRDGASLSLLGGFQCSPPLLGTKSWSRVTFEFATGQETEIKVAPRLGMYSGLATGTAWFAELTLVELGRTTKQR